MAIVTPGVLPASALLAASTPDWLRRWAEFATATTFSDLPQEVVRRTKLVILDSLGAIVAGRAEPEVLALRQHYAASGQQNQLSQAFVDGTAGTSLEIDEGNQYARGHPGMHVVPAVLAVGTSRRVTGRDAILSIALGYEIGARIGIGSKLRVAMHPHGTWGTVGAALAVAKLAKASQEEITTVVNIASSMGLTTSRRTMLEGATVRNTYAGASNMMGLMAWSLVQAGFRGETDGIGSVYGGIVADDWRPEEMVADLGQHWEIARNYFKRHAACRYTHGALDALAQIVAEAGPTLTAADVRSIHVETYVWAAQLDHAQPKTMLAAKFSMPFALATFITHGGATLDAFRDDARADAQTAALAARVTVSELAEFTAQLPHFRPARVTVTLSNGRVFSAETLTNKGDTEDPYSAAQVREKFVEVTGPVLGIDQAQTIADAVDKLDDAPSIDELYARCETPCPKR